MVGFISRSVIILACLLILQAAPAAMPDRITFGDSVAPLPVAIAATRQAMAQTTLVDTMEFGIALRMRDFAGLQARVANGEIISRAELENAYLPLQADYDAIVAWLEGEGFTITQHDPSRLIVYASGTLDKIQASLQTTLVNVTSEGTLYHAAVAAPSLPFSIATPVLGINGLQPFRHRRTQPVLAPQTANKPPYLVSEILTAYNGKNLGVTGANQKIAILIDTTAKDTDMTAFWAANGISQSLTNIEKINVNGGTLPAVSGEETLDEQWTSGIAPGAKIRVYASRTLSDADLDKCFQRIINDLPTQPQLHQLSISLGLGETYSTSAQLTTDAQLLASIASGGVSIFVSSGDNGSTPSSAGDSTGPLQVEYYSSDVSVTSVGGTSLNVNSTTGQRTSETAWSGSGGGVSGQFARPSWQTGTGVPAGTKRVTPDVCFAADPNTGAYVYLNGSVNQYGGTSWSAPSWAGICALINEARANAGKPPLGLLNPSLYPLIGTSNFIDITSGSNALGTNAGGKYSAVAGYDQVTGIGSPNIANLLTTLVGQATPAPIVTSFTPTSGVQNTSVVITGSNFSSATAVTFNGTSTTFTVNSSTQITTSVPAGATTGPISVTTPAGTGTSAASFTVNAGNPAPLISGFNPLFGISGTSVVITGSSFTGATAVAFNGTAATFSVNSATQITTTVPTGATSGAVTVTTPSGTATSPAIFTVLTGSGVPTVTSFTPTSGAVGGTVVITGTNFVNVTSVTFNGTASASVTVNSPTQITASVPTGATSGTISVVTGLGTGTSGSSFTVLSSAAGPVVISQVYGGGGIAGATYKNDCVELYNRSASAVSLANYSIQYASSTGTAWTAIPLSGTIQPGHYFLVQGTSSGTVGASLPTPDVSNASLSMSSTKGKLALMSTQTAITSGTSSPIGLAALVDFVGYGSADAYEGTGPAPTISATTADFRAGAGATDTGDNASDFSATTPNPRNSSSGSSSVDLTVAKTHSGSFVQGDVGRTYSITVSNAGSAASSGTVTLVDTLPSGLTATDISGTGWTTNLGTLTCTRTDSLAAGASYPSITLTVNVSATAPASVTNTATVSGGGDSSTGNNAASDVTTISTSGGGTGGTPTVLASWDVSGQTTYGTSPLAATTSDSNVTVGSLTRGSGLTISGTAATRAWGGNGFDATSEANAITASDFATFAITGKSGYTTSITSISKFDYRRSTTGPPSGELQYQIGSGAFVDAAAISYSSTSSSGASLAAIDLSGISALQNVAAGTAVTFRIVNWGASTSTGTWYIYDVGNSTAADFAVTGTVTPVVTTFPDLTISKSHSGTFTQGDTSRTYTLTVTNSGNATTSGTVSVIDTVPSGLVATGISGTGWTATGGTFGVNRSDALAAGASYPPITVTVDVATNAAASVTNSATVAGGGETNTANDSASDPTTITALTPSQAWRLQWFGDSSNSGAGADGVITAGDGLTNLQKYAFDMNPFVPSVSPVTYDMNSGFLRGSTPKNASATDITIGFEVTGDLKTSASWTTSGITIDQNTATLLQAHDNTPLGGTTPRFMRLRVTRP